MRAGLAGVMAVAIGLAAAPGIAQPPPPPVGLVLDGIHGAVRQASCRALAVGTAGAPESAVVRTPPDRGNGLARNASTNAPRSLPVRLVLRTTRTTFNRRYWFALDHGHIWYRSNADITGLVQPWTELPTPACFEGQVAG